MNLFILENGGIYKIINLQNSMVYYGQTISFIRRCNQHIYLLKNNNHFCLKLQNDFNSIGLNYFSFEIIQVELDSKKRLFLEKTLIEQTPHHLLYNENSISNFRLKPRIAQKVKIHGIIYKSIAEAVRLLKQSSRTIRNKLDNPSNFNYERLESYSHTHFDQYEVFINDQYFKSTRCVVKKKLAKTTRQVRERCKSKKWPGWIMRKKGLTTTLSSIDHINSKKEPSQKDEDIV